MLNWFELHMEYGLYSMWSTGGVTVGCLEKGGLLFYIDIAGGKDFVIYSSALGKPWLQWK